MNDINKIKDLLDLYWECETTLEQEAELKSYFTSDNIDSELLPYAEYFAPLADLAGMTMEKSLEDLAPKTKVLSLQVKKYIYAAAAVLVLGLASIWVVNNNLDNKASMAEVENPDEALKITKDALAFLSNTLNSGAGKVQENIKHIDKLNIIK